MSTNFSATDRANILSVIHFNARSLKTNLDKIKDTVRDLEYKFHVIAISESWFKENNWDANEVSNLYDAFSGYKLYYNSRNNTTGGGVAIFVCDSLLRNYQSPNICLRNISYTILNVSKVFLLNNRLLNIQKSMSAVYIEHRILALTNVMEMYHI